MGHWWNSLGMSIGLVMLWRGLCLRSGASCSRKRELHIREPGQDKERGAGSEEDAVLCQSVFQERLDIESESVPSPVMEEVEEVLEIRLAPVVLAAGREEGCDQERDRLAEMEPQGEEMKWQVHWPQPKDEVGRRLMLIWQAAAREIREAEVAAQLGVTERRAREYVQEYRESGSSLAAIDRRHFNRGQQVEYRLAEHKAIRIKLIK